MHPLQFSRYRNSIGQKPDLLKADIVPEPGKGREKIPRRPSRARVPHVHPAAILYPASGRAATIPRSSRQAPAGGCFPESPLRDQDLTDIKDSLHLFCQRKSGLFIINPESLHHLPDGRSAPQWYQPVRHRRLCPGAPVSSGCRPREIRPAGEASPG